MIIHNQTFTESNVPKILISEVISRKLNAPSPDFDQVNPIFENVFKYFCLISRLFNTRRGSWRKRPRTGTSLATPASLSSVSRLWKELTKNWSNWPWNADQDWKNPDSFGSSIGTWPKRRTGSRRCNRLCLKEILVMTW